MPSIRSLLRPAGLSALAAFVVAASAAAQPPAPGYVDLGQFAPPSGGGQFVEVNLSSPLLKLAARLAGKKEPAAASLLNDLHSVRVNVIEIDDDNRADMQQRAGAIRDQLLSQGWQQTVTVRERRESVAIYVKLGEAEVIQGVTVVVLDGDDEAVFVNVVGNIRPEQLATLGDRLNLEPLKHLELAPAAETSEVEKNG